MRAGVCSVQQALTPEAAAIVKQAVGLARRRGHAQVTPLHVASAMLAASGGLLRQACRKSHSHPLQCKALELCFNVALNRLPAAASSPLFGPHSAHPSLSNALVAAFKRAQAHQRRGSIENQQQPILALKIESEQLAVSILDDPSVSRVMREAGISSTLVKSNVEQAISSEIQSQSPCSSSLNQSSQLHGQFGVTLNKVFDEVPNEDVMSVLDTFMAKRRQNTVIVGESSGSIEGLVRKVMEKFERGDVNGDLRYVQFISLPLISLKYLPKEEVEQRLVELKCLIKGYLGRGVVLYLGDLKWVAEFWSNHGEQSKGYYCPVEHMIMELRRLVCGLGEISGKIWLMGVASFKTYMRCKTGHPSLEAIWELHPLTIPSAGGLDLSLNLDSNLRSDEFKSKASENGEGFSQPLLGIGDKNLTCCADCVADFDREARSIASTTVRKNDSNTSTSTSTPTSSTSTSLPLWLKKCKEEAASLTINDQQERVEIRDLCNKWNSICNSVHKSDFPKKTLSFFAPSPSSSTSISSYDQHRPHMQCQTILGWPMVFEPKKFPKEHQFWTSTENDEAFESNLRMFMSQTSIGQKPDLLSNPNSSPNSASSSEAVEDDTDDCQPRFKELNSKNLKIICSALERKAPRQADMIPDIASTVLRCRSGLMRRKGNSKHKEDHKEETWLFFLGLDSEGKEKVARELAKIVFGSHSSYVSVGPSSFSSTMGADSTEELGKKRARDESGRCYIERFAEAARDDPHRVFFLEDVEQIDRHSRMGLKRAIESGRLVFGDGELVPLKDAIVIFSCESLSSVSRACSPPIRRKTSGDGDEDEDDNLEERSPCVSLDLNMAIEDENGDYDHDQPVADHTEILDSVDKQVIFKFQEF